MNAQSPNSQRRPRKRLALPIQNRAAAEPPQDAHVAQTAAADTEAFAADHQVKVALAAYFIAEKRGFEPGHELDDWLAAEAEVARGEQPSVGTRMQLIEVRSVS